jgi:antirestriction protein ArdC
METLITRDVYAIVTNLIIQKLENGIIPWKQPWRDIGVPRNLITQRPYRGMNLLLLSSLCYEQNEFLTFNQVQDLGGRVKKGEKAHLVVLWVWIDDNSNKRMQDVKGRKIPLLRYYFVFNVTQCTGLPKRVVQLETKQNDPIERCEEIVRAMPNPPKIVHNENEAYYHPLADFINMPKIQMFESSQSYYSTLFHELIHSTGYEGRLNRKELVEQTNFGSELYSIEELTAEIGSCYMTSYAGIAMKDLDNSVAYLQGWLKRLQDDNRLIVYASAHAQKAVDYILNIKHQDNDVVSHLQNEVV